MSWVRRARSAALGGDSTACVVVLDFQRERIGAVGKWKTCFWFPTFPSALVVGTVGMWESRRVVARIPKGLVERGGSLLLAFHAFHRPAISTVLLRHDGRRTGY